MVLIGRSGLRLTTTSTLHEKNTDALLGRQSIPDCELLASQLNCSLLHVRGGSKPCLWATCPSGRVLYGSGVGQSVGTCCWPDIWTPRNTVFIYFLFYNYKYPPCHNGIRHDYSNKPLLTPPLNRVSDRHWILMRASICCLYSLFNIKNLTS